MFVCALSQQIIGYTAADGQDQDACSGVIAAILHCRILYSVYSVYLYLPCILNYDPQYSYQQCVHSV